MNGDQEQHPKFNDDRCLACMVELYSDAKMEKISMDIEKELLEKECEIARRKNDSLKRELIDMILGSRTRFVEMVLNEETREMLRHATTSAVIDPGKSATVDAVVTAFDNASKLDPVDLLGNAVKPVDVLAAIVVLAMIPPSMKDLVDTGSIGDPATVQRLVEMAGGLPA